VRSQNESLLDTIAALATPVGRSALAVLRISGKDTLRTLAAIVAGAAPGQWPARRPSLATFVDGTGQAIDRGLLTFFPAPASATGEDVAELSVHGSPVVVQALLAAILKTGARLAKPGEFTERAFLRGKIDLVEAEAIGELIDARTSTAARVSARRLEGKLSARLESARETLLEAAAQLAATIDFSEDVGEAVPGETISRLGGLVEELEELAATYATGRLLTNGCRVAIVGPPNAGKSTLFNALVGSERAIVTEIPGTTRDTLEATVDVAGIPVEIVDTAGLRDTEDRVEQIGVARAREVAAAADALIYVLDARGAWSESDTAAMASVTGNGKPILVIANKSDMLAPGERPVRGELFCGLSPDAGERLGRLLHQTISSGVAIDSGGEIIASLRQKNLVERCRGQAATAVAALKDGEPPQYAATHVNSALDALADLVGETTSEDVLRRVFATFCIGK
jgi:tRNA modification GTPase